MKYNFDELIDRKGTQSVKWDDINRADCHDCVLPMWVADMDFACPKHVVKALKKRADHPIYGYSNPSDDCLEAIADKVYRDYGWEIQKEWIVFSHGVVDGLHSGIKAFCKPGDEVIIQRPVYHPFTSIIEDNGCKLVDNALINRDGRYEMDFEDLEKKLPTAKAFILCSPHNPVGRVWTRAELDKVSELCLKHDCIMLSDEIHGDIILNGNRHMAYGALSDAAQQKSVTLMAVSKMYNVPGLATAFSIIPNDELRSKYMEARMGHIGGNMFGYAAIEAAYVHGYKYKKELLKYIAGNMDYFTAYINEHLPKMKVTPAEGTYLAWVDMRGLGLTPQELDVIIKEKCKLALNAGGMFGEEGEGFYRFNLGCPRSVVNEALYRLKTVFGHIVE